VATINPNQINNYYRSSAVVLAQDEHSIQQDCCNNSTALRSISKTSVRPCSRPICTTTWRLYFRTYDT